jgi:hypothetical protein
VATVRGSAGPVIVVRLQQNLLWRWLRGGGGAVRSYTSSQLISPFSSCHVHASPHLLVIQTGMVEEAQAQEVGGG